MATGGPHLFVHLPFSNSAHSRRAGHAYQHPLPHPRPSRHSPLQCVQRLTQSSTVLIYLTLTVRTSILSILQMGRLRCQQSNSLTRWCAVTTEELALFSRVPSPVLSHRGLSGTAPGTPRSPESRKPQSPGVLPLAWSEAVICVCVCFSSEVTKNEFQPQLRCGVSGSGSWSGLPAGRTVMESRLSESSLLLSTWRTCRDISALRQALGWVQLPCPRRLPPHPSQKVLWPIVGLGAAVGGSGCSQQRRAACSLLSAGAERDAHSCLHRELPRHLHGGDPWSRCGLHPQQYQPRLGTW